MTYTERSLILSRSEARAAAAMQPGDVLTVQRKCKPQPCHGYDHYNGGWECQTVGKCYLCGDEAGKPFTSPLGAIGTRVWGKETTIDVESHGYDGPMYTASEQGELVLSEGLRPDFEDMAEVEPWDIRQIPSVHMPRKHARLFFTLAATTVVQVEGVWMWRHELRKEADR